MAKLKIVMAIITFMCSCTVTPTIKPKKMDQGSPTYQNPDYTNHNIHNRNAVDITITETISNDTFVFLDIEQDQQKPELEISEISNTEIKTDTHSVDIVDSNDAPAILCGICFEGLEATEEKCNYLDDDCDCETDEDWANYLGQPCKGYYQENQLFLNGFCTEEGVVVCNPLHPTISLNTMCSSADEISIWTSPLMWNSPDQCTGLDTNCNGLIDEDCDIEYSAKYCEPIVDNETNYLYGYKGCCGTFQETENPQLQTLIKTADNSSVYYFSENHMRYLFPISTVLDSWYSPLQEFLPEYHYHTICEAVYVVSDEIMAEISLGGMVLFRPGVYITGAIGEEDRFLVNKGMTLRPVDPVSLLSAIYGGNQVSRLKLLPDEIVNEYFSAALPVLIGEPVMSSDDFDWDDQYFDSSIETELNP